MDPLTILKEVNSFYSSAFSHLMTLTIAIAGVSGIFMPIILQLIQSRSNRIERESLIRELEAKIAENAIALKREMELAYKEREKEFLAKSREEFEKLDKKIEKEVSAAKGGIFVVQGNGLLKEKNYMRAAVNYSVAAKLYLIACDEMNSNRAIKCLREKCLPNISQEEITKNPETLEFMEALLKILEERNENRRYADDIVAIKRFINQFD